MVKRRQKTEHKDRKEKPNTPLPRSDPILLTALIIGLWNFKGDLDLRIKGASLGLHKQAPTPILPCTIPCQLELHRDNVP